MQLLLIKTDSQVAKAGDIIGTFPDEHVFTSTEHQVFDIVQVKEMSRSDVDRLRPQTLQVVRPLKEGWIEERDLERKQVWRDVEGNLKEIAEKKKYPLAYKDGLFVNNYAVDVKNQTVLVSADIKPVKEIPVKG
jgi:hypothetical protein